MELPEGLQIVALQVAFFAFLIVAGIGLAAWLAPRREWMSWAPLAGAALLGSVLVTGGSLMSGSRLALSVLAPVLLLSVAAAAVAVIRRAVPTRRAESAIYPGLAALPALLVGSLPYASNDTAGPLGLYSTDAWFFYLPLADYLDGNAITSTLGADFAPASHRIADLLPVGFRVGFEETLVVLSTATGVDVRTGLAPLLGALLMVLAVTVYALAREAIGLGPPLAALTGAVASSASLVLVPTFESSGPSLFAYSALPAALWMVTRAIRGEWRSAALAGVLGSGILAVYPEALVALLLGVALLILLAVTSVIRRRDWQALLRPAGLLGLAAGVAAVLSPVATSRSARYMEWLGQHEQLATAPDWGIGFDNVLPMTFSFLNYMEARRQEQMGTLELIGVFVLVAIVVLLVATFFATSRRQGDDDARAPSADAARAQLVSGRGWLAAALVAITGVTVWTRIGESCAYCFYRSSVFAGPMVALGVVGGLVGLWMLGRHHRALRVTSIALAAILAATLARSTYSTVEAASASRTLTPDTAAELTSIVEAEADHKPVLVEGADADYHVTPFFFVNQALHFVANGGARPVLDRGLNGVVYGGGYEPFGERAFDAGYGLVATRFGGIRSDRETIGVAEPLTVKLRAPYDVSVQTRDRWAVPAATPSVYAVPWISGPFHLLVSAPDNGPVDVLLGFDGPRSGEVHVAATQGGAPLTSRTRRSGGSTYACIRLPNASPFARVESDPGFDIPLPGIVLPDESAPALPQEVAVTEARAGAPDASPCDRAKSHETAPIEATEATARAGQG